MRLYSYFRSSAAYRVRIALALKGLAYETVPVHLRRGGGEHHLPTYLALNPERLVPALELDGRLHTQSLALIEYLDELNPLPPLLPREPADRAWVRALAQHIACDIHPLNNLRVLQYLEREWGVGEERRHAWIRHWIQEGFAAIEKHLSRSSASGLCCFGDAPTLADCVLVPQVANATRFHVDLARYPRLARITEYLTGLEPFRQAAPERQVDAE